MIETLAAAGVGTVRLPLRSPNLNAVAERFVRTIKESCLDRVILIGEASLRRAIREFEAHYQRERNRQGLQNRLGSVSTSRLSWLRVGQRRLPVVVGAGRRYALRILSSPSSAQSPSE